MLLVVSYLDRPIMKHFQPIIVDLFPNKNILTNNCSFIIHITSGSQFPMHGLCLGSSLDWQALSARTSHVSQLCDRVNLAYLIVSVASQLFSTRCKIHNACERHICDTIM